MHLFTFFDIITHHLSNRFQMMLPGAAASDWTSCRSASVGGTGREKGNMWVKHQGEENLKAGFTFIFKIKEKKKPQGCSAHEKNKSDFWNPTKPKLTSCPLDEQSNGMDEREDQQGLHGEPESSHPEEANYDSRELGAS